MPRTDNQNSFYNRLGVSPVAEIQRRYADQSKNPGLTPGLQVQNLEVMRGQNAANVFDVLPENLAASEFMRFIEGSVELYKAGGKFAQSIVNYKGSKDNQTKLTAEKAAEDVLADKGLDTEQKHKDLEAIWAQAKEDALTTNYRNAFEGARVGNELKVQGFDEAREWEEWNLRMAKAAKGLDPEATLDLYKGSRSSLAPNNRLQLDSAVIEYEKATIAQAEKSKADVVTSITEAILTSTPTTDKRNENSEDTIIASVLERLADTDLNPSYYDPDQEGMGLYIITDMVSKNVTQAKALGSIIDNKNRVIALSSTYASDNNPENIMSYLETPNVNTFSSFSEFLALNHEQGESGYSMISNFKNFINNKAGGKTLGFMLKVLKGAPKEFWNTLPKKLQAKVKSIQNETMATSESRLRVAEGMNDLKTASNLALDYAGIIFSGPMNPNDRARFRGAGLGENKNTNFDAESSGGELTFNQTSLFLMNPEDNRFNDYTAFLGDQVTTLEESDPLRSSLMARLDLIKSNSLNGPAKEKEVTKFLTDYTKAGLVMLTPEDRNKETAIAIETTTKLLGKGIELNPDGRGAGYAVMQSVNTALSRVDEQNQNAFLNKEAKHVNTTVEKIRALSEQYSLNSNPVFNLDQIGSLEDDEDRQEFMITAISTLEDFMNQMPSDQNLRGLAVERGLDPQDLFVYKSNVEDLYKTLLEDLSNSSIRLTNVYEKVGNTLRYKKNSPEALTHIFQQVNDAGKYNSDYDPFDDPEIQVFLKDYVSNIKTEIQGIQATRENEEGEGFILTREDLAPVRSLIDPLLVMTTNFGDNELSTLNERIYNNKQFSEITAGLGSVLLSNESTRSKYAKTVKTNEQFARMMSRHVVDVLSPAENALSLTGEFEKNVEHFFNPWSQQENKQGGKIPNDAASSTLLTRMFNLGDVSTSMRLGRTSGDIAGHMGTNILAAATLYLGPWLAPETFSDSNINKQNTLNILETSPLANANMYDPQVTASQILIGAPFSDNFFESPNATTIASEVTGRFLGDFRSALQANPVTAQIINDSAVDRLERSIGTSLATAQGVDSGNQDVFQQTIIDGLPPGTEINASINYGTYDLTKKGNQSAEKIAEAIKDGKISFSFDIRTGLANSDPDRPHSARGFNYTPPTPLANERLISTQKKISEGFPQLSPYDIRRTSQREAVIYSHTARILNERTLSTTLNDDMGFDLSYSTLEGGSTLGTLIKQCHRMCNTNRHKSGADAVAFSPTGKGNTVQVGDNGLTVDASIILSAVIEQQAEISSNEELHDFVSLIHKELAVNFSVGDETVNGPLTPFGIISQNSNGGLTAILNQNMKGILPGDRVFDTTLLMKYAQNTKARPTPVRDINNIWPYDGDFQLQPDLNKPRNRMQNWWDSMGRFGTTMHAFEKKVTHHYDGRINFNQPN